MPSSRKKIIIPPPVHRTGFGFDAHSFSSKGTLVLGGLTFKNFPCLKGHSDGDAVIHAVIDSLLGGAGAGDIGDHFSDKSVQYKGISSLILLRKTLRIVKQRGFVPTFIDLTIVAEKPRLSKIKSKMGRKLAEVVGLPERSVNVKAKTPEGTQILAPEGAIAVWAVATLTS